MNAILLLPALVLAQTQTTNSLHTALTFLKVSRDFVQLKDNVYALLPPVLVSEGAVSQMQWSSDGATLAFVKCTNPPRFDDNLVVENLAAVQNLSLCEWSFADPHVRELFAINGRTTAVDGMAWLPGSDVLLVNTQAERPDTKSPSGTIYRFRPLGDPQELVSNSESLGAVEVSPSQNLAIVFGLNSEGTQTLSLIEEDGTKLVPVEPLEKGQFSEFDKGGWPCVVSVLRDPLTGKRQKIISQRIDLQTGVFKVSPSTLFKGVEEPDPGLTLSESSTTPTNESVKAPSVRTQWVNGTQKSQFPAALVSMDTEGATISSKGNAVAYSSQGCVFVRRIVKLDPVLCKALVEEYLREDAVNKAKQVALAALMYSDDYDDNLPNSREFASALLPYIKNGDLLSGFTFSYTGNPNLTSVENPATTVLGFVQTSFGRAVSYVDGHVKWIPNP